VVVGTRGNAFNRNDLNAGIKHIKSGHTAGKIVFAVDP